MSAGGNGTRTLAAAVLREAAGGERPPAAELRVLDGPLAGCRLPLGVEETLGRGAAASLRLPDPAASRRHLRLRAGAGGVRAEDLGSKNGWELNGSRRRRGRLLRHGDVIAVGGTRLALELGPRHLPAAPAALPESGGPAAGPAGRAGTGGSGPRAATWAALLLALAAAALLAG